MTRRLRKSKVQAIMFGLVSVLISFGAIFWRANLYKIPENGAINSVDIAEIQPVKSK